MPKTLLVMRHGKSGRHASHGSDHDRTLADRGIEAARRMGLYLSDTGQVPDLVLASSAIRARTTAELAGEAGDWDCAIEVERNLYGAGARTVLDLVREQGDEFSRVLVAGHEPTCSELVGRLIGGAEVRFPTGAVARVDFDADVWRGVEFDRGTLVWFMPPRLLVDR